MKKSRNEMLQVALRHGTSVDYDKVSALLADKPLLALEAIRLGREVGYVKPADLLIVAIQQQINSQFEKIQDGTWEQHKRDYSAKRTVALDSTDPEISDLRRTKSRLEKNLQALERVKPKDLLAADIHVELGATWIPPRDIERFMRETFNLRFSGLSVNFSEITGLWRVEGKKLSKSWREGGTGSLPTTTGILTISAPENTTGAI